MNKATARPARIQAAIPSAEQVSAMLRTLTLRQLNKLGEMSDVPAPTLTKIRNGQTANPGIETVRKFLALIEAARQTRA